jgi:hypothetical protein
MTTLTLRLIFPASQSVAAIELDDLMTTHEFTVQSMTEAGTQILVRKDFEDTDEAFLEWIDAVRKQFKLIHWELLSFVINNETTHLRTF